MDIYSVLALDHDIKLAGMEANGYICRNIRAETHTIY